MPTIRERVAANYHLHNSNRELAEAIGCTPEQARSFIKALGFKPYPDSRMRCLDNQKEILNAVTRLQYKFKATGDSDAYKHYYRRTYERLGFKTSKAFLNRVTSYMRTHDIEGYAKAYVEGRIERHNYAGIRPIQLLTQPWDMRFAL